MAYCNGLPIARMLPPYWRKLMPATKRACACWRRITSLSLIRREICCGGSLMLKVESQIQLTESDFQLSTLILELRIYSGIILRGNFLQFFLNRSRHFEPIDELMNAFLVNTILATGQFFQRLVRLGVIFAAENGLNAFGHY